MRRIIFLTVVFLLFGAAFDPLGLIVRATDLGWRTRARKLDIPDYSREISPDGKLILHSGQLQVVLPDDSPSAEEFGRIQLYGLRRAYVNTESLLGRPPFARPDMIKEEFVVNLPNTGQCCGPEEEGFPMMWNAGNQQEYKQMINLESPNTQYLETGDWSQIFKGNHELIHRFVLKLDLSQFINEGLAMYAQDHGDPQCMTCGEKGYEKNGQFTPYTYLCASDVGMVRLYTSGDCFWQRIEEKYGQDMVKRIVARLYDKKERDYLRIYTSESGAPTVRWHSFSGQLLIDLQQAFVPEIGDRFWEDFRDFGLYPTMAEGMTYESERVRADCR